MLTRFLHFRSPLANRHHQLPNRYPHSRSLFILPRSVLRALVRRLELKLSVPPFSPSLQLASSPPSISLHPQDSADDSEDDSPPPFPLLNSHQRSSAPSVSVSSPSLFVQPAPSFSITPPGALRSIEHDNSAPSFSLGAGLGGGGGAGNTLATPTTTTKVVKARGKVGLSPGHSPLDWARVKSSGRYDGRSLKVSCALEGWRQLALLSSFCSSPTDPHLPSETIPLVMMYRATSITSPSASLPPSSRSTTVGTGRTRGRPTKGAFTTSRPT